MDQQNVLLQTYYDKGYRSLDKLFHKLEEKGYEIPKPDVRRYIDSRKVKSRVKRFNKSFMGNKFSAILDTWQIDTYTTERYKTNYLLAINVNTRYAWCMKRKSMTTNDFLQCMEQFIKEMHPKVIECDEEKSFTAYKSVQFLRGKHIIMKVFTASMGHEPLSIINKLCRTLRVESRDYDGDPDIPRIIKIYNKSYHSSIKMPPREMQFDRNKELKYIYDQLALRDSKEKLALKDPIEKGDKVRYIRDEDRGASKFQKDKMKYQLSRYYYIVETKHSTFSYDIVAADGSVKTVPRYKLYKLTPTEEKSLSFAPTLEDKSDFQIFDEIIDYNPVLKKDNSLDDTKTKYTVRVISRDKDGKKIKDEYDYAINQLRVSIPTEPTTLELEFLKKHKDEYYIDKETGYLMPK